MSSLIYRISKTIHPVRKTHIAVLLWYMVLSVMVTWPLIKNFTTAIVGGQEAQHILWVLWHIKEAILGHEPLFHTSLLYAPLGITLLTHSLGPVTGLFAFPFWLLGPEAAYNAAILIGLSLTGYFMYLFARSLKLSSGVSLFAGTVLLMAPIHLAAVPASHLDRVFLGLMPLTLMALNHALVPHGKYKWVIATPFLFLALLLHSGLQFIFTGIGAVFLVVATMYSSARSHYWDLFKRIATTAFLTLFVTGGLLFAFWNASQSLNIDVEKNSESVKFQPDIIQYVVPHVQTGRVLGPFFSDFLSSYASHAHETAVYISWTTILLTFFAYKSGDKSIKRWLWFVFFFILLSFGPNLTILGETEFTEFELPILMPYAFLTSLPGLEFLRTPGRFMIVAYVGIAILSSFGLASLINKSRKKWQLPILILAISLLLIETWPSTYKQSVLRPVPDFYQEIANDNEQYNVFDLPIKPDSRSSFATWYVAYSSYYQMYQMVHGKGIASGYLSRIYVPHPIFGHVISEKLSGSPVQENILINGQPANRFKNIEYELASNDYRYVVFHKPQDNYTNYYKGSWGELTSLQFIDEVFDQRPPIVDDDLVSVYEVSQTVDVADLTPNIALINGEKWTSSPIAFSIASPVLQIAELDILMKNINNPSDEIEVPRKMYLSLESASGIIVRTNFQAGITVTLPLLLNAGIQTVTLRLQGNGDDSKTSYNVSLDRVNLRTTDIFYTSHTLQNEAQIVYGSGWYKPEVWDYSGDSWYWSMSPSSLWVYSPAMRKSQLETVLGAVHSPNMPDRLGSEGALIITVNKNAPEHVVGYVGQPLVVDLDLHPGWNEIVFELEAGNFRPADTIPGNGDARQLSYALKEFAISFK